MHPNEVKSINNEANQEHKTEEEDEGIQYDEQNQEQGGDLLFEKENEEQDEEEDNMPLSFFVKS